MAGSGNSVIVYSILAVVFLCFAIACLIDIIVLPIVYSQSTKYNEQYAVVMDAGSSHSDIYLYQWDLPLYQDTGVVSQNSVCKSAGNPINTYTVPSEAAESFQSCVDEVLNNVPGFLNNPPDNKVNMWLGASANMRILRHENRSLADSIINEINTRYQAETQINAKILTGQEEAVGRWITTNYIVGTLARSYPSGPATSGNTVGALDMGGGDGDSLEVAFIPSTSSPSDHMQTVSLFGNSYDVYGRSYLCYGTFEGFRRIVAYAVMNASYSQSVDFPCFPTGYTANWPSSFIFGNHYCSTGLRPADPTSTPEIYNITGTSDPKRCQALIGVAMDFNVNISNGETINHVVPRPTGSFYGFSNFYYTGLAYNTFFLNSTLLGSFSANVSERCSLTWSELTQRYGSDQYRVYRCVDAVLILHFLEGGLGFDAANNDWSIRIVMELNSLTPGWSLGYMLQKTSEITSEPYTEYPFSSVDLIAGLITLIIACIVFTVMSVVSFFFCKKSCED
ncbi:PREDICTED: ectonucleoside triphosphate diphosphohydrolase 3-like [Amphimedon queenslandica]|uniref:Ectonucleoside triphosphate diphosphohydrolase 8 n=1 Tax=Amphimedon queenslandica TaxID=400682 RepID=A0A1X7UG45_AMPQE|nr:PREDICTED: ectonucleoside triphosphate diphosphohydrolase 3-like [Amphimedon queenslandica]|eukprot:XP_019854608.1 PREDICTED: ectonucleoside triphosphate diphosphohydrolase 3-like [Amphimedon queenslandica]